MTASLFRDRHGHLRIWALLVLGVAAWALLWMACEGLARSYSDDPLVKCHAPAPLYFKCKAVNR